MYENISGCVRGCCGAGVSMRGKSIRIYENRAQISQDTFLSESTLCLPNVICYLLSSHEDADRRTESYEYAYAYDHQYECLHLPDLLYYGMYVYVIFCHYTNTPIAALRPTNTPTPTTINTKACISSNLLVITLSYLLYSLK